MGYRERGEVRGAGRWVWLSCCHRHYRAASTRHSAPMTHPSEVFLDDNSPVGGAFLWPSPRADPGQSIFRPAFNRILIGANYCTRRPGGRRRSGRRSSSPSWLVDLLTPALSSSHQIAHLLTTDHSLLLPPPPPRLLLGWVGGWVGVVGELPIGVGRRFLKGWGSF